MAVACLRSNGRREGNLGSQRRTASEPRPGRVRPEAVPDYRDSVTPGPRGPAPYFSDDGNQLKRRTEDEREQHEDHERLADRAAPPHLLEEPPPLFEIRTRSFLRAGRRLGRRGRPVTPCGCGSSSLR